MIAKLAYLHSPAPDRYILFFQEQGKEELQQLEISEGHLANIIADGAHYAFRKQCVNRVPFNTKTTENAENERAASGA